jgi:hypothetical protein
MAVFTRTNGNAQNVVSVGNIALSTEASSLGVLISTGIGKPVRAFTVNSNVALTTALGTGEAVEAILGVFGQKATLLAYQVGSAGIGGITNGLVSILTEDNSWTTTDLEANIVALGTATGTNLTGVKVAEPGLKLVTTAGA